MINIVQPDVMPDFEAYPKIPRLNRECIITEKIDGTNAQIYIDIVPGTDNYIFLTGSRNQWITPEKDNMGFARWANDHREELILKLGSGKHGGEWWGKSINKRKYGIDEKRFSLFQSFRWIPKGQEIKDLSKQGHPPDCCHVVPVLYTGPFDTTNIMDVLENLKKTGSVAAPGGDPEGIIIFHTASRQLYKVTCKDDESPKGMIVKI